MTESSFEGWAIIELMGHNMIIGECSQETIAGEAMLRVDVPSVKIVPPGTAHLEDTETFTKFFNGAAIYGITPCEKETALELIARNQAKPIKLWKLHIATKDFWKLKQKGKSIDNITLKCPTTARNTPETAKRYIYDLEYPSEENRRKSPPVDFQAN